MAKLITLDNLNTFWTEIKLKLNNKVDNVMGKGLSSNDYTNADKAKVDAIPTNPKYTDTTYDLSNYALKSEIKTRLDQMTSDSTHRTVTDAEKREWDRKPTLDVMNQVIIRAMKNKVDKVDGKGLSTNDFTNTHKSKLDNLSSTASGNEATTSNRGYMSANDKVKLNNCMRCKVLTQVQYDALSPTDKNREDTLYFIKE